MAALIALGVTFAAAPVRAESVLTVSTRTGDPDIFVVDIDTGDARNLTKNKASDLLPSLSPDGRRVAFTSDRSGTARIYLMDIDGDNVIPLTHETVPELWPAWSPDGERIIFGRMTRPGLPQIFVVNKDGSGEHCLTPDRNGADPAWSPDGRKIVYTELDPNAGFHVFVMDADGSNAVQVTARANPRGYVFPAWSPDGKQLAYADLDGQNLEIFVCDADGDHIRQLTRLGRANMFPAWAPDGKRILFQHVIDGNHAPLCMLEVAGNGVNVKPLAVFSREAFVEGARHVWKVK